MKIGIIGSGNIGGTLGLHLADVGYEVMFSSRHPKELNELALKGGDNAMTGYIRSTIRFGDMLVLAVPFWAVAEIAEQIDRQEDKIIIDVTNPFPDRDGEIAEQILNSPRTASEFVSDLFARAHVVKAFNTIYYEHLRDQAYREGEPRTIPHAGDHQPSVLVVRRLITEIGFEPVYIGGLSESRIMEPGQPLFTNDLSEREIRDLLEGDTVE